MIQAEAQVSVNSARQSLGMCVPRQSLGTRVKGLETSRLIKLAILVWLLIVIVVCSRAILRPHANTVLTVFTTGAQCWRDGTNLYAPIEGIDAFRYCPTKAVLMVPFQMLPDQVAGVLWRLLNFGFFLGTLAWWLRAGVPRELTSGQRALVFLLVIPLALGSLNNGQSNPLVIGLLLAAVTGAATERMTLAGGCAALACLLKVYPVAVGLLLAVLYPRRFLPRFVAALALGLAIPFLFQKPDYVLKQYANWVHHLQNYDREALPIESWYRDVRLLFQMWLMPLPSPVFHALQLLTAAGIAGLCLAGQRVSWPQRESLLLLLSLGCCWMLAFGPATESCTHILIAPALAYALVDSGQVRTRNSKRTILWCSYGFLTAAQASCWFPWCKQFTSLGIHALAVLLVMGWLTWNAVRRLRLSATLHAARLCPVRLLQ